MEVTGVPRVLQLVTVTTKRLSRRGKRTRPEASGPQHEEVEE